MLAENNFQMFLFFVLPPLILLIGIFGNVIGLLVLKSKRLNSMATRKMYCYLFIFDTLYLTHLIQFRLKCLLV